MSMFISGISDDVVKECRNVMLVKEIDRYKLMARDQQIKVKKIKKKEMESEGARIKSFNFSSQRSDGGNHSHFCKKSSASALFYASDPKPKCRQVN